MPARQSDMPDHSIILQNNHFDSKPNTFKNIKNISSEMKSFPEPQPVFNLT